MVNKLKILFDRMGIDVWEVIDAAKTKPFDRLCEKSNFQKFVLVKNPVLPHGALKIKF